MLEIKNLQYALGDQSFQYNFSVKPGVVSFISGRSGSGKTTLLHLISGFFQPDSGEILYDSVNLIHKKVARRPIAYMMQGAPLFEGLTALELVQLGLQPSYVNAKTCKEISKRYLERLGFSRSDFKKKSHELSGGQRSRVALAQTLILDRPIILLDEPFDGLDKDSKEACMSLLDEVLKDQEIHLLLTSHDVSDAKRLSAQIQML